MTRRGGRTSCRAPAMPTALVTTEASAGRVVRTKEGRVVMADTIAVPTEWARRRPLSREPQAALTIIAGSIRRTHPFAA